MVHIANESLMEDLVAWTDIIGTIAGILVLVSFIPQIIKAYKIKKRCLTSSSNDFDCKRDVSVGYLWNHQIRPSDNWN